MLTKKDLAVVIMAAGKGTRMKNPDVAKVMYTLNGKPMIGHAVDLAFRVGSSITVVVVGWQKDSVVQYLEKIKQPVTWVEQTPQRGTGHAVMQTEPLLGTFRGDVLVLSGDVPLLSYETTQLLIDTHRSTRASATVLTAEPDDPEGYGRILRNTDGSVLAIVEDKDATEEQRRIREINTGIYVFDAVRLFESLRQITPANSQNEYYLTDVFGYFWKNNLPVSAVRSKSPLEVQGINTPQQLEDARAAMAQEM